MTALPKACQNIIAITIETTTITTTIEHNKQKLANVHENILQLKHKNFTTIAG